MDKYSYMYKESISKMYALSNLYYNELSTCTEKAQELAEQMSNKNHYKEIVAAKRQQSLCSDF